MTRAIARLAGLALGAAPLVVTTPNAMAVPATHVSCGQIITADTKLANDLKNCPRHGIIIGADGITLDLNGHTVDGDGALFENCPQDEPCNGGIINTALRHGTPFNGPGFDDVTIRNGIVRDFAEGGVYVVGVHHAVVSKVRASHSEFASDGIHLHDCTHCRIEDSSGSDYSVAIVVGHSRDVVVQRSRAFDNSFAGIIVADSEQVEVSGNTVTGTDDGDGIVFFDTHHSVVTHNHLSGNAAGVGLNTSDRNVVAHNNAHDNRFVGIYAYGSDRNRIIRNAITRNGDGFEGGIHLVPTEEGDGSDNNVLASNRLVRNLGDGILVDAGQSGTIIRGNLARRNSDDGIDVDSSSATLSANKLIRNGDLGIEAPSGVKDGGGNVAVHNGTAQQCLNVECG